MQNTSDKYLLQIEPNEYGPPTEPINDELTDKVKFIYECTVGALPGNCYKGIHDFKIADGHDGVHATETWVCSDNCDHFLPDGTITNSLCVYYVQRFRPYIPKIEIDKIHKFYEMCKSNPSKRWKKGGENSVYVPTIEFVRVIPTEAEEEAQRQRWAKEREQMSQKKESRAAKAEADDTRNPLFKEIMKNTGFYRPQYDPEAHYWNNIRDMEVEE